MVQSLLIERKQMTYSIVEYDAPHQSHALADEILRRVLRSPSQARDGDVVALGFPIKLSHATGRASYDMDYPLPEIMVMKNGRLTLGADEDVSEKIQPDVLRWVRLCKDYPDNIQGGLELTHKICTEGAPDAYSCHVIVWYFIDFISANLWFPTLNHYGFARSLDNAGDMSSEEFEKMCTDYKTFCGITPEILFSHRNQQ
jgi:hypothetical protein